MSHPVSRHTLVLFGCWCLGCATDAGAGDKAELASGGAEGSSGGAAGAAGDHEETTSGGQTPTGGRLVDEHETGAIATSEGEWVWANVAGAVCGDGSATGLAVNRMSQDAPLLIYLQGGGACWDEQTCLVERRATNFTTGFGEAAFRSLWQRNHGLFDRSMAGNPFAGFSFAFVPYCTGDVHAGSRIQTYGGREAYHVGALNLEADLVRLARTFKATRYVIVAGTSAGGYGSLIGWWRVVEAFPDAVVELIDDSGVPLPTEALGDDLLDKWHASWDLAAALPADCDSCRQNLDRLVDYYAERFPGRRGALLSYTDDIVLPTYFGIDATAFRDSLLSSVLPRFDATKSLAYFVVEGEGHGLLGDFRESEGDTTLGAFLVDMQKQDAKWTSVMP